MKDVFGRKSIMRWALTWTLLVLVPACQAQSAPNLDKHARKVQKRLTKYPKGTYVDVAFRDGTDSTGMLGTLSPTSFTFTNADNNASETHLYSEVARVDRSKEYIGDGSEPGHHFHVHLWVPVVVGAAAAGAAVAAFELR
jgi:hypothetical protein